MKKGYNLLVLNALSFFFENPYKEVYLREFARTLKLSPNTAQRFLDLFVLEGFVKEEKKANLRYFKAALDNIVFKHMKIAYSLNKLRKSGILSFFEENNFSSVILFGSMAKGENDLSSDIDIVCIGSNKGLDLSAYEKRLGQELNVHFFTMSEWKKQKKENRAFYYDVIFIGINLIGEIPVL